MKVTRSIMRHAIASICIFSLIISTSLTTAKASGFATQSSSVVTVISQLGGVNETASGNYNPPDVAIAVGPGQIMESVNRQVTIYNKQGTLLSSVTLNTFFQGTGTDWTFDPRVLYDTLSQRWFATIADGFASNVRIAVSKTSNATTNTSDWNYYVLGGTGQRCYDQPRVGVSSDKVAVTAWANGYPSSVSPGTACITYGIAPITDQYWILNKADMLSGAAVVRNATVTSLPDWVLQPMQSLSPTNAIYMETSGNSQTPRNVTVVSVNGLPPGTLTNSTTTIIPTAPWSQLPYGAPTPDIQGATVNEWGDGTRVQSAAWFNGALWSTYLVGCTPTGDNTVRSCVQLLKLNTNSSTPTIMQNFDYAVSGQYYFYPALSLDGRGNMEMIFGYSNSTTWPTLAITGQAWNDPAGAMAPRLTIKASNTMGGNGGRFGDYFGAAPDPSDPTLVWMAGEYLLNSPPTYGGWYTGIFSARLQDFTVTVNPSAVTLTTGQTTHVTVKVSSTSGGFSSPLTLSATGPTGITLSFVSNPITPPPNGYTTTTLNITPDPNCHNGSGNTITVQATSGSISHMTSVTITLIRC